MANFKIKTNPTHAHLDVVEAIGARCQNWDPASRDRLKQDITDELARGVAALEWADNEELVVEVSGKGFKVHK